MHIIEPSCLDEAMSTLLSTFDSRGYVVVRDFLNSEEVERFASDFRAQAVGDSKNYVIKSVSDELTREVNSGRFSPIAKMVGQVAATTSTKCDGLRGGVYFASELGTNFGLHQDHESYWQHQDHQHFLNMHIQIVKPDPERSNLQVVPFDRLPTEIRDRMVGNGASRLLRGFGEHGVFSDDSSGTIRCHAPENLEALIETPQLSSGDLLLMRGDVMHKTQDADTKRVALSYHAVNSRQVIRRDVLMSGGLHKLLMMMRDPAVYSAILAAFSRQGKDELAVGELLADLYTAPATVPEPRAWLRQLLAARTTDEILQLQYSIYLAKLPESALEKARPILDEIEAFRPV
jgi:hypothetical protein